jgi:hypothetical protein
LEEEIKQKSALIADLQEKGGLRNYEAVQNLQNEVHSLLAQEELQWRQWSKELWLRNGDRNTKFFHESAKQKRGRDEIEKIVDAEGVLREDPQEVESALVNYFSSLFMSDYGGENIINLQGIEGCVTPEMNVALVKEFSKEEIKEAIN